VAETATGASHQPWSSSRQNVKSRSLLPWGRQRARSETSGCKTLVWSTPGRDHADGRGCGPAPAKQPHVGRFAEIGVTLGEVGDVVTAIAQRRG